MNEKGLRQFTESDAQEFVHEALQRFGPLLGIKSSIYSHTVAAPPERKVHEAIEIRQLLLGLERTRSFLPPIGQAALDSTLVSTA